MFKLGLTGVIGSGKSKVSQLFENLGAAVIDCDVIAHQLTSGKSPIVNQLRVEFGERILDVAGNLDRIKLRSLIFSQPQLRIKLENILHPAIFVEVVKQLGALIEVKYCIIVVPLLFKVPDYLKLVDRTLVVDCDYAILLKRLAARNSLAKTEVDAILLTQVSREEQLRLADDVIENNSDEGALLMKVQKLHHYYMDRYCNAEK